MFFRAPPFRNDLPCNDPSLDSTGRAGLNFSSGSHSAVPFYSANSSLESEVVCWGTTQQSEWGLQSVAACHPSPAKAMDWGQEMGVTAAAGFAPHFAVPLCTCSAKLNCNVSCRYCRHTCTQELCCASSLFESVKCFMLLALWNNTETVRCGVSTNAPASTHKPQTTGTVTQHQWRGGQW